MRERISIEDLLDFVESNSNMNESSTINAIANAIIKVVNSFQPYINEEGIQQIKNEEMNKIK